MSMCKVVSCVVRRGCFLWPVRSLDKTLLAFSLLHFVLQSQIWLLWQGSFYITILYDEKNTRRNFSYLKICAYNNKFTKGWKDSLGICICPYICYFANKGPCSQSCGFFNSHWTISCFKQPLEKTQMLGKIEANRRRGQQSMRCLDSITNSMDMNLSKLQEIVKDKGAWCTIVHGDTKGQTQLRDWTATIICVYNVCVCVCVCVY